MKTITIDISPLGETKIKSEGFSGSTCLNATRPYEQALGGKTGDRKTAEYHQTNDQHSNNQTWQ